VFGTLGFVDLAFLSANSLKIVQGGWLPLAMAASVFVLIDTWRKDGTTLLDWLSSDELRALVRLIAQPGHEQVHLREVLGEGGLGAAVDEAERAFLELDFSELEIHGLERPLGLGGRRVARFRRIAPLC
jgi:hypothetical protein